MEVGPLRLDLDEAADGAARPGVRRFTVTETREVMEVRADNLEDVAEWCGGKVQDSRAGTSLVVYPGDDGANVALVGDFVVHDGQAFESMNREEFGRHAAQWEETT